MNTAAETRRAGLCSVEEIEAGVESMLFSSCCANACVRH